jgi:FkbM family methyltransferase
MFSDEMGWAASLLLTQCAASLTEKITVTVKRLETIISEQKLPVPELLKMDVQGAELNVLRGAGALLNQVQVIQAEVWFRRAYGPQTPLLHEALAAA